MSVDPKRVQAVFLQAVGADDPAEQAALLDRECGADAELRRRVEALVRAHRDPDSLLNRPAAAPPETITAARPPEVPSLSFLQPPTQPDSLGRIGHYEVLEVLGRGGFGIVFRAFDDVLRRVVAVKVLSPELAVTSPARKRFLREARAAAQVRHENVVQIYAVEEEPLPYIVMEFVPGETLQERLDRTGPLDAAEVVRIGRQIALGLSAAHATGLIHRDIKPANVLVEDGLRVKITDFGLARAADDASISQSGLVAGTPMYMSPEQARGEGIDPRSDLFSLGSVLYTLTAGRPPFRAGSTLAVLKRVREDAPRPIVEIVPEAPAWLCAVIARLHAKRPDQRYQTAAEAAEALTAGAGRPVPPVPSGRKGPSRRLGMALALGLGVALSLPAVGLVAAIIAHRKASQPPKPAPTAGQGRPVPAPQVQRPQPEPAPVTARPNPADSLDRKTIPPDLLARAGGGDAGRAPAELVAILGNGDKAPEPRRGHAGHVNAVAFSPDGKTLVSAGEDKTIRLWDMATGQWQRTLNNTDPVRSVAFRPDGKALASAGAEGSVRLWDLATYEARALAPRWKSAGRLAFSPDGKTLAFGSAGGLSLWDADSGERRLDLPTPVAVTSAPSFSPEGKELAAGCAGGAVYLWNPATGWEVAHRPSVEKGADVFSVAYNPNPAISCYAAPSPQGDGTVQVLFMTLVTQTLDGHAGPVRSCLSRADGRRLVSVGSKDGIVRLWDRRDAVTARSKAIALGSVEVLGAALSPEGRYLATANADGTVYVLRLGRADEPANPP